MKLNDIFKKISNGETIDPEALKSSFANHDNNGKAKDDGDEDNYRITFDHTTNPTRWEKAVMAMQGMVKQVSKVDPDGLDIVCFGGSDTGTISIYRNVKNVKDVEKMVTSKLPSGPCKMGMAMDTVLQEAFDKGFRKRPCGILVLTAGQPDDADRLEKSLQNAAERIARAGYKEPPISVTLVHIGDDEEAEDYMQHLANNMVSDKKSKKTGDVVDIVDTIKDRDIQAAMKEIKGTSSDGKTGAIVGAFAGAAMGVGGMYVYNKHQAKKRTQGWNGTWRATYESCEIATLTVRDNQKGNLVIEGFPGGTTTGNYASRKNKSNSFYNISFRDAEGHWHINGCIEDEHTIFWSDGTRWDEIPPEGGKWTHYAGAAAVGAATGGAIGYLLDKKFFKKCSKKDQCDYVIMVDRSSMMAVKDKNTQRSSDSENDDDADIVEYQKDQDNGNFLQQTTDKFNNLSTGEKVAVGVVGTAAVAGVAAAGVGIAHAVKGSKEDAAAFANAPVATARAVPQGAPAYARATVGGAVGGLTGKWRATYEGDTLCVLNVSDDRKGKLHIDGFMGGVSTTGKYTRSGKSITQISFVDADEHWNVNGTVKGESEAVIMWSDDTRWDKIA